MIKFVLLSSMEGINKMDKRKGVIYQTIYRKALTIAMIGFIFILGIWSYMTVPKQEYPVIQAPAVIITAIYPGISASDMESLVTEKIEDTVMEIDDVDSVESKSLCGVSIVTATFNYALSIDEMTTATDDLRNKIDDLKTSDLPDGVTKLTFDTASLETPGAIIAFTSDEKSNAVLAQKAEQFKDNLGHIHNIKKVEIEGKVDEEIEVVVETDKLNYSVLSLSGITSIISNQNSILPMGSIDVGSDKIDVNGSGAVNNLEEIENLIVQFSRDNGSVVRLKDIADIKKQVDSESVNYRYNGKPAVLASIYFKDGINMVSEGPAVHAVLEAFKDELPEDIHVESVAFLPEDVGDSINDFTMNLVGSVVIVLFVVMIGMSFKNGVIVSVAIPLSIFIAFIAMNLLGIEIQFVSLAALIIALGMLVDNAIVISDAIQVRVDQGESKLDACINGTKEVAFPVLTSTLTTVAIFAIFFLQPGTMGAFITSLPSIVIISLLASYMVSILVTPFMCYFLIDKSKIKTQKHTYARNLFLRFLEIGLKRKKATILLAVTLIFLSGGILSNLEMELLPKSDKMILDIDVTTPSITNIDETRHVMEGIEAILSNEEEVTEYLVSSGGRVPKYDFSASTASKSADKGSVMIRIDLSDGTYKSMSDYAVYLQNHLKEAFPGNEIIVSELGVVPSIGSPVQVKITGDDLDLLNMTSQSIESELEQIEGVKNVKSTRVFKENTLYLDMSNSTITPYGLTKASIQNELNIALMGREATVYRVNSEEYPIVVKSDIDSIDALKTYMLTSSTSGEKFMLKQIVDVGLAPDYSTISRYDGTRTITIGADTLAGYSADTVQKELKNRLQAMDLGDVNVVYEGDSDMLGDAVGSLAIGAVVGIMAILAILMVQFNSFKQVGIILCSVPFGFIGATLGMLLYNRPISMFTMLGIVSLIGVVVNNAIVLVDFINAERNQGIEIEEACREAVKKRFRPIVLSSTTTIVGLIPLALPGNPLFQGMAIAFMAGLAISVVFTLIVIPIIYAYVETINMPSPVAWFKALRR